MKLVRYQQEVNFGDLFFASMLRTTLKVDVLTCDIANPIFNDVHVVGPGSISQITTKKSIVAGSGLLSSDYFPLELPLAIFGVRGSLTQKAFAKLNPDIQPKIIGDYLFAYHKICGSNFSKGRDLVLVPHLNDDIGRMEVIAETLDAKLVWPNMEAPQFFSELTGARGVISRSLHGLIAADSLRLPRVWLHPSDKMIGGTFKFLDYFSSIPKYSIKNYNQNLVSEKDIIAKEFNFEAHSFQLSVPVHWFMVRRSLHQYSKFITYITNIDP